ncbi:putative ribonuclease z protein [Phaeoacremonium minimum UCRPA7]|uniref:ribonuclease Z n=1 Tax=Phaeoacremonium minimum (strain UCR-PA7) TaxID=1286976 RepID=R8BXH8_PHAM7|nr:putative ribonuclease z protein [Phaeoacremonium minimum UCRPA7]EOO04106.1 putative ribonuclease z protein [Phaeoacremonium minimum UCRPA7]
MLSSVQVLSTPTADTPGACLLLHFENRRYLFGHVAEGTQRITTQRKVALAKSEEIFLTGPISWKNVGGLLGMILTIADVVAGQKASRAAENEKKKAKNKAPVSAADGSAPDWQDSNIQVWYVLLNPDGPSKAPSRKRSHDMISDPEDDEENGGITEAEQKINDQQTIDAVVNHMFDSDWQLDALVETTLHKAKLPAMLFVKDENGRIKKYEGPMPGGLVQVPDLPVLNQPRRGKFNVKEAERLGVKKEEYKLLTQGKPVTSKDGQTVTPDMVVGATIEGDGFAIVDIPDISYVDAFLARPEWSNIKIMKTVQAIYWTLGSGVAQDARIQDFMKQHPSMRHTVFSTDICSNILALESPAAASIKNNRIDPERFPLLHFNNQASGSIVSDKIRPFEIAQPGATMQLAPQLLFQDDKVVPLIDTKRAYREVQGDVLSLCDAARAKITPEFLANVEETEKDIPNRDAEIIPLGTGSALPSKYRNVSATLVRVPGYGNYLFDCGENTLGQIHRFYGFEAADEMLRDLKAIWISHLHADHHLGTASVIRAWRDATAASNSHKDARLAVASHVNMLDWLREYADVEDYGYDRLRLVELKGPPARDGICTPIHFEGAERDAFGLSSIEACRVDHCFGALACVLSWPSGLKIAYSGDCRPSSTFAKIGRGATLLIHEATLDDELSGDALVKKHSTMSEALGVAREMEARRVLLTHFSQRYPKIPVFGNDSGENGVKDHQVVLMAFDHMRVKLGDFQQAELFLPALRKLLEEDDDK